LCSRVQSMVAQAESTKTMLWGSLVATVVIIAMVLAQRILDMQECLDAFSAGMKGMVRAGYMCVRQSGRIREGGQAMSEWLPTQ